MNEINAAVHQASMALKQISDVPRLEAELLLAHILKVERTFLHRCPERNLTSIQSKKYDFILSKRLTGKPLAYILGTQPFWSIDLYVNKHTLIPRSETEKLVEIILTAYNHKTHIRVLDLGTGSGAIALALAKHNPTWHVTATDISKLALKTALKNSQALALTNVNFLISDWYDVLQEECFDIIVSNPPYVAVNDPYLEKQVHEYEPENALISGPTGLEALRSIIQKAPNFLKNNGLLIVEHAFNQGAAVRELMHQINFTDVTTHEDCYGKERITAATKIDLLLK